MLRLFFDSKIIFRSLLILITALGGTGVVTASEDWVYDLRYKEFQTAAENGDGAAMYELGVMNERGHGTERDVKKAIQWYQKAIQNDYPEAYVRLGKLYLEGVVVDKDFTKAFKYLSDANKKKASGAHYYLAVMYENGYGTKRNLTLAKSNYDKAANWGHFGAQEKSKKVAVLIKKDKDKAIAKANAKNKDKLSNFPVQKSQTKVSTKPKKKQKSNRKFVTIKDIKKNLLSGMWFNGDRPLGFLPSPQTYCISKKKVGLKCVSKEMQRNTGREKVHYLMESKISNIDNYGDFTITYKNKVTKVDIVKNEMNKGYVSLIKVGPQRKEHVLKCNVIGKNVKCKKNGLQQFSFVNLIKAKKKSDVFETAFE